jgi:hypothetical protein
MRKLLFDSLRERPRRLRFSDGNTVQPDNRLAIDWRKRAKALAKSGNIFTVRQRLNQEVRDQNDETER